MLIKRDILPKSESNSSLMLLGSRKTGKTTYLRSRYPNSTFFDLLDFNTYNKYKVNPGQFNLEIQALIETGQLVQPVIIDQIQRIPVLLDGVHLLIEKYKIKFILCGSSARKLYQAGVNMLGGRAIGKKCFPLTYKEVTNSKSSFNLLTVMQRGLIPSHYLSENEHLNLIESYVRDYLDLEVRQEGLVRKADSFHIFLDSIGFSNAELLNFSSIARDCSVSANTVKTYYQILLDTFIGYFIYPFKSRKKRQTISTTPKFYLFDVGLANYLSKSNVTSLDSPQAGKLFEQFIYLELIAYNKYKDRFADIHFWRTKHGIEVDFIVSTNNTVKVAIECKLSKNIKSRDFRGIEAFTQEHEADKLILVSLDDSFVIRETSNNKKVYIMPYTMFLKDLWEGKLF